MPTIERRYVRRTRKAAWCAWCRERIERGSPCMAVYGYAETGDRPWWYRAHVRCTTEGSYLQRLVDALGRWRDAQSSTLMGDSGAPPAATSVARGATR